MTAIYTTISSPESRNEDDDDVTISGSFLSIQNAKKANI
jgi:hypothetical protein